MSENKIKKSIFPDIASLETPCLMSASLDDMRRHLLMPLEYIQNPQEDLLQALTEKIMEPDNNQSVIGLSHRLTSREINLVFPLLLYGPRHDKTVSEELSGRIHLIIRERASLSLYVSGWLCFQFTYPNPRIAKALTLLCDILNIRRQSSTSDMLPIISEVIPPDSRQFTKQLTRRLSDMDIPLKQFMQEYGLAADLPLGAELISQTFLQGSASMFAAGHKLYAQVLRAADQQTQVKLLQHFFALKDLKPSVWNRYCQLIYRQFGEPDSAHPIWQKLKKKHQNSFRYWITAATIGSHCHNLPQKAHLYLRYANWISKIEAWDSETLILSFMGFVIADSKANPELAIYYDEDQAEKIFRTPGKKRSPASPDIPRRRVDEAIRRNNTKGIIGLPFDAEGIRYSEIFLEMCLHDKAKFKPGKQKD